MGTGAYKLTTAKLPNAGTPEHGSETTGDELRWSKETARSSAKAPNSGLSGKRCGIAQTARRLA